MALAALVSRSWRCGRRDRVGPLACAVDRDRRAPLPAGHRPLRAGRGDRDLPRPDAARGPDDERHHVGVARAAAAARLLRQRLDARCPRWRRRARRGPAARRPGVTATLGVRRQAGGVRETLRGPPRQASGSVLDGRSRRWSWARRARRRPRTIGDRRDRRWRRPRRRPASAGADGIVCLASPPSCREERPGADLHAAGAESPDGPQRLRSSGRRPIAGQVRRAAPPSPAHRGAATLSSPYWPRLSWLAIVQVEPVLAGLQRDRRAHDRSPGCAVGVRAVLLLLVLAERAVELTRPRRCGSGGRCCARRISIRPAGTDAWGGRGTRRA